MRCKTCGSEMIGVGESPRSRWCPRCGTMWQSPNMIDKGWWRVPESAQRRAALEGENSQGVPCPPPATN